MRLDVGPLPHDPLEAAVRFHADVLPRVLDQLAAGLDHLTLVFTPADHTHEDWRRAVVATLARERTPARINAIAGDDAQAIDATSAYIAAASGLTGQYLVIDPAGAGSPAA